jgi:ABC-type branched-subunit amino acid transport system substrate-binding protein
MRVGRWLISFGAVLLTLVLLPVLVPSSGAAPKLSPIDIGFEVSSNLSSSLSDIGGTKNLAAATPSDDTAQATALVAWLNKHGGLGGHKVVGVYHNYNTLLDRAQLDQSICTDSFQDHHVFAYIVQIGSDETEPACFKTNHGILIDNVVNAIGTPDYAKYAPYLYSPLTVSQQTEMATLGHEVVAHGWNNKSFKVGIYAGNYPAEVTAVDQVLVPYLKSHGVNLVDTEIVQAVYDPTTFGLAQAPTENAILKFKSEGVNHIIVPQDGYLFEPVYAPKAIAQNYNPVYAFFGPPPYSQPLSSDPNKAAYTNGSLIVTPSDGAGTNPPITPVEKTCHTMYNSVGLAMPFPTPGSVVGSAYSLCDDVLFLQAAFKHGAKPTGASFKAAVASLGTSLQFGSVHSVDFSASNPYAPVSTVRDGIFSSSCGCYTYDGPWHAVTTAK